MSRMEEFRNSGKKGLNEWFGLRMSENHGTDSEVNSIENLRLFCYTQIKVNCCVYKASLDKSLKKQIVRSKKKRFKTANSV